MAEGRHLEHLQVALIEKFSAELAGYEDGHSDVPPLFRTELCTILRTLIDLHTAIAMTSDATTRKLLTDESERQGEILERLHKRYLQWKADPFR